MAKPAKSGDQHPAAGRPYQSRPRQPALRKPAGQTRHTTADQLKPCHTSPLADFAGAPLPSASLPGGTYEQRRCAWGFSDGGGAVVGPQTHSAAAGMRARYPACRHVPEHHVASSRRPDGITPPTPTIPFDGWVAPPVGSGQSVGPVAGLFDVAAATCRPYGIVMAACGPGRPRRSGVGPQR